jgi:hypothetical protein
VLDEPVRVDDRDRPLHPAQRQALARGRHAQALDRRRDVSPRSSSAGSSATATSPSSSSRSNATPTASSSPRRRVSLTLTHPNSLPCNSQSVERPPPKFHDDSDILERGVMGYSYPSRPTYGRMPEADIGPLSFERRSTCRAEAAGWQPANTGAVHGAPAGRNNT